jgi:hypothetical protein
LLLPHVCYMSCPSHSSSLTLSMTSYFKNTNLYTFLVQYYVSDGILITNRYYFLKHINRLVVVTETRYVFSELGAEFLIPSAA